MPSTSRSERPTAQEIDRLQRRRTRLYFVQAILFVVWQTNYVTLRQAVNGQRLVDQVTMGGYILWSIVLLAFIGAGGGWRYSRQVRAILDDESTLAHRRQSMVAGFWAAMATCLVCYAISFFEPLTGRDVLHFVMTFGIAVALLTFAALERRAQRDA